MKEIPFTPLSDFVLIQPLPKGETAGGIALPDGAGDSDASRGKVLKVGPGRTTEEGAWIEPNVQPGDVAYLYFAYSAPIEIVLDGTKYVLARCRDLVGLAA